MSFSTVQTYLNDIERKITKSNAIASKDDKIGLRDALKLGAKANSIAATLKKQIAAHKGLKPTEEESKTLLAQMTKILELTETQLGLLVKNKPRFEALKVGGLVKRNLAKTSELSAEQEKVMLEKTPVELKPEAEALGARRKAAFDKATAAFAQSVGGEDQADNEEDSD